MYPSLQEHDQIYRVDSQIGPAFPASRYPSPVTSSAPTVSSPYICSSSVPAGMAVPAGRAGEWSTRLFHCCDDPANCLITCFCPCITFGQIAEIVDRGSTTCVGRGALYGLAAMTGFACLYSCFYRSKLRGQYDLEEDPSADCLVHFFCEACALCQEYRELRSQGFDMGIGWEANMDRRKRGVMIPPLTGQSMTR